MNGIPEDQMLEDAPDVNPFIRIVKKCSKCQKVKLVEDFYLCRSNKDGRQFCCKECLCEQRRFYYKNNVKKVKEAVKIWRLNNPEKHREINRRWQNANLEKHHKAVHRWRKLNPEKYRESQRKEARRKYKTIKGRLNSIFRGTIRQSLNGNKRGRHWEDLVGYNLEQLKKHLEKQFTIGMTWENHGKWHIDHIIPISAFNFEKPEELDFKRCWALKNLQPLWAEDNIKKRNKLIKPFQPSLIFN